MAHRASDLLFRKIHGKSQKAMVQSHWGLHQIPTGLAHVGTFHCRTSKKLARRMRKADRERFTDARYFGGLFGTGLNNFLAGFPEPPKRKQCQKMPKRSKKNQQKSNRNQWHPMASPNWVCDSRGSI